MLARIHKAMRNKDEDQGFTLIELLVVMIIIGILAAIAIPVFLNQRKKAVDASMRSDVRNIANNEFSYYVDNNDYVNLTGAVQSYQVGGTNVATSKGNTLVVTRTDKTGATAVAAGTVAEGFCIVATNPSGSRSFVYNSQQGGIQDISVTACP